MTLLAQQTISYKTYIKETLVSALREVFRGHPDPLLAKTQVTIDFPFTELDYPAVVVRFYERTIKNVGVGHYEMLETPEQTGNQEIWFDNFEGIRDENHYFVRSGSYPTDGVIPTTEFSMVPYTPQVDIDAGTTVGFTWNDNELITIKSGVRTDVGDSPPVAYGEVEITATEMIVKAKYRSDTSGDSTLAVSSISLPTTDAEYWLETEYVEGVLSVHVFDSDPLLDTAIPLVSTSATVADEDIIEMTSQGRFLLEAVADASGTSAIFRFRTNRLNSVLPPRYIKHKHYLYQGDIEFAVYALSSYDRDIISDSLVQTLAMADTESYTNSLLNRLYEADPLTDPGSLYHYINLNTDEISGFGESQVPAPWQPEDVLVYQTSYRIAIHGEFYSRTPDIDGVALVEEIQTYPYMPAGGETKPDPNPEDPAVWD